MLWAGACAAKGTEGPEQKSVVALFGAGGRGRSIDGAKAHTPEAWRGRLARTPVRSEEASGAVARPGCSCPCSGREVLRPNETLIKVCLLLFAQQERSPEARVDERRIGLLGDPCSSREVRKRADAAGRYAFSSKLLRWQVRIPSRCILPSSPDMALRSTPR